MTHFRKLLLSAAIAAALGGGAVAQTAPANRPPPFALTSPAFEDGGILPNPFSGAVTNPVSPPFAWINSPAGTQSYVLQIRDMEPVRNKSLTDIVHWLAFNIPGSATALAQGQPTTPTLADGTEQANNTGGHTGFMAPGAPPGVYHHYVVELFALDGKLGLPPDSSRDKIMAAMNGHILGKAVMVFRFHR